MEQVADQITCKTCQSNSLVRNPCSPRSGEKLICKKCDFKPEAIKRKFTSLFRSTKSTFKDMPWFESKKTDSIFEQKDQMNPYLSDVFDLVDGNEAILRGPFFGPGIFLLKMARAMYLYKYAHGIPCLKAIEAIAKHSPIIEIGAGNGYWAHLIEKAGADIVAFDKSKEVFYKIWFDVQDGSEKTIEKYPDRNLLLCWPEDFNEMSFNCLKSYKGKTLLYVGEPKGGCTASASFFRLLESDFNLEQTIELPVWFGFTDKLFIFSRKP